MKKEEAFEASEVVNWLLATYDSSQFSLTNLKLNKLIYFLHGVSLARDEKPLIRNNFECWTYGPVVASLYSRLKMYGDQCISRKLMHINYEIGLEVEVDWLSVERELSKTVRLAAKYFVSKDVGWLVSESHEAGGAWDKARSLISGGNRSIRVQDSDIREHFVNKYGGSRMH